MLLKYLLKPEILELIDSGGWSELRAFLMQQPAPEIAELMGDLDRRYRVVVFRLLPRTLADEVFALLDADLQNELIEALASDEVKAVLSSLSPDDRTALFEELPAEVTRRLLELLPESKRRETLALLSYPQDSVGRLMTTAYVTVRPEWSAADAIEHVRKNGQDSETLAELYVTDDRGRLTATVSLRRLILAPPTARVAELMESRPERVLLSQMDRELAVRMFRRLSAHALPVTDADGILLGVVTIDDILDVEEEETTEDFHKLAKVVPIEGSFRRASIFALVHKRVGWLVGLVVLNLFSGAAIAPFEDLIRRRAVLVTLLPLLIDSGGNAGSQTATLVIRALALGELTPRNARRLLLREFRVGAGLGAILACVVFGLGYLRGAWSLGVVSSLSMMAIIWVGCFVGFLLPVGIRRLGMDPATAGAPLITSVCDVLGILVYFTVATWVFNVVGGGL